MRIAFIGQKGIPAVNRGIEKHVENLAVHLAEMGHDVFVYVRNNYTKKNLKEYKGVKLIHLPSLTSKNFDTISYTFLATIHSLFRKYDVIHYQDIGPASLCFIPRFFKKKTLVVSTLHSQNYLNEKWGWLARKYLEFGEWIACKISERTISTSKILRNHSLKKYKTGVSYIPNGAKVEYNPETKTLERWQLKENRYILSVEKNVTNNEGIFSLISAFKKLENTNKIPNNFKLVIVGNGFHIKKSEEQIKKISQGRENIIFTKNQTGASLEQLFSHAYIFVQPSRLREFSTALLEAMGYGTPVLASDIPENIEAVGKCGFFFKVKKENDLEEKLAYLINKPAEIKKFGKLGKERIQKNYSWDSIARKTLKIYEFGLKRNNELKLKKLETEKLYVQ